MFKPKDVDEYISAFPPEVQEKLHQLRSIVRKQAPLADELLSYRMPAYKQDGGILVYFAAYKHHIGFYPTGSGIAAFENDLAPFKYSKGAIQFPLDRKLPVQLIRRIVRYRALEVAEKAAQKKSNGKK